jgi:hypothetical protein
METELLICNVCLRPVAQYNQNADGTQLFGADGEPKGMRYNNNFFKKWDKFGLALGCPAGHRNYIPDCHEAITKEVASRFMLGKVCPHHHLKRARCDRRQPCLECIVYKNREV